MLGTVSIMGLASVLMGLLPTYAQIGVWAPALLVALRIIQGFALGGESTGAQLMALEHANAERRGKYSGLLGLCSPLSQILANAVLLLLSSTLAPDAFESYGWRIPFLLSFVLVVVGIYIRLKVEETPAFVELKKTAVVQEGSPLRDALRLHYKTVLRLMFFFGGPAAIFYLIPMLAAMGLFLGFTQFQSGIQPVAFAEAFPTNVRYSGSALAYTGANLLAGGPMPLIAVYLVSVFNGSPWGVVAFCVALNLISLAMILMGRETRGIDMNRVDSTAEIRSGHSSGV